MAFNLLYVVGAGGIVVTWRQVSSRKALQERLLAEREFLGAVLESLEDGVVACDADGVLTLFNDATRRLLGLPEEPLPPEEWAQHYDLFLPNETTPMRKEDVPLFRALSGEVVRNVEMVIAPKNGRRRLIRANGRAIFGTDGVKLGAVVTMHDTTQGRAAEQEMLRLALTDPLTGLGNRASLTAHLNGAVGWAASTAAPLTVLVVDLDDFKKVNDGFGHASGDLLLVEIASRLRRCLRGPDAAVRLGGDEFAVVLEDTPEEQATLVADRILAAIREPFALDGNEITIDASIGIATSSKGDRHAAANRLLRAADLAMYVAKSRGKGGHAMFEPDMHLAALGRLSLEADLRRALAEGQLTLAYQPVVSLTSGAMVGVEALLRWQPPGKSPVPPDAFIQVAEESGLIEPIGAWVLLEACTQARLWDEAFPDRAPLIVAVNVSARQLQRNGLTKTLMEVLDRTGLHPGRLVMELTESTLTGDDEPAMRTLREIDQLGVKLSIDDFGTGYSSLSRLRTLPISAVKIDRSFVNDIQGSDASAPLVVATLAMARGLGLSVVAEGIETTDQLDFLCRHGCPEAQGYLLSRPVDATAISRILAGGAPLVDLDQRARRPNAPTDLNLMEAVEGIVTAYENHEDTIRPLLAAVARITGLESTFVTQIHWERSEQVIRFARNTGELIAEGLTVDCSDPLWQQALLGGPAHTDEVPAAYPDSMIACQLGLQTYLSIPIPTPDGRLFGTLCGASTNRRKLGCTEMAIVHLFAHLIGKELTRSGAKHGATDQPTTSTLDPR